MGHGQCCNTTLLDMIILGKNQAYIFVSLTCSLLLEGLSQEFMLSRLQLGFSAV